MEYLFCFCVFYKFPQWLLTAGGGGGGAGAGRSLWPESIWCPSLIIDVTTGVYILTAPPSIITHPLYGHPLPPTVVKLKIENIIEKVPFKFRKFSISDLIDIWVFEQSAMSVRHTGFLPGNVCFHEKCLSWCQAGAIVPLLTWITSCSVHCHLVRRGDRPLPYNPIHPVSISFT